jgi:hypothetical protein
MALGGRLLGAGWAVRGTSRSTKGLPRIEAAGIEASVADPDRPGTVLDLVADVAVVHWLMGSAVGEAGLVAAIHGPRLERLLEKLVESPVRGFVYEAAGAVASHHLERGAEAVRQASETWRMPTEVVAADPSDHPPWLEAMVAASSRVLAPGD